MSAATWSWDGSEGGRWVAVSARSSAYQILRVGLKPCGEPTTREWDAALGLSTAAGPSDESEHRAIGRAFRSGAKRGVQ